MGTVEASRWQVRNAELDWEEATDCRSQRVFRGEQMMAYK